MHDPKAQRPKYKPVASKTEIDQPQYQLRIRQVTDLDQGVLTGIQQGQSVENEAPGATSAGFPYSIS